jgi:hypothetical protein
MIVCASGIPDLYIRTLDFTVWIDHLQHSELLWPSGQLNLHWNREYLYGLNYGLRESRLQRFGLENIE